MNTSATSITNPFLDFLTHSKTKFYEFKCKYNNTKLKLLHRTKLPTLDSLQKEIVHTIETNGFYVTTLDQLNIDHTDAMLKEAESCFNTLQNTSNTEGRNYIAKLSSTEVSCNPEIVKWGLNEWLLDIAENYLKLPVTYRGPSIRKDLPLGEKTETRLWHKDGEDFKILKIIFYANDVDATYGPFKAIPKPYTPSQRILKNKGPKMRISDKEMEKYVNRNKWRSLTGKKGTIIFVDTSSIFHCGEVQTQGARHAIFYCYNSNSPKNPSWCYPQFDIEVFNQKNASQLTEKQKRAITFNYSYD